MASYSGVLSFPDGDTFRVQRLVINDDVAPLDAIFTWDGREYSYSARGNRSANAANTFVFVGVPLDIHAAPTKKLDSDVATVTLHLEVSDEEICVDGTYVENVFNFALSGVLKEVIPN